MFSIFTKKKYCLRNSEFFVNDEQLSKVKMWLEINGKKQFIDPKNFYLYAVCDNKGAPENILDSQEKRTLVYWCEKHISVK